MIFKTFLPAFISGFILFGVADYVNIKLKLLQFSDSVQNIAEPLIGNKSRMDLEQQKNDIQTNTANSDDQYQ